MSVEVRTIENFEFHITPIKAKAGLKAATRIVRAIGPPVVEAADNSGVVDKAKVLANLIGALNEDDADWLCTLFEGSCKIKDTTGTIAAGNLVPLSTVFDVVFGIRYTLLIQWMGVCFQVHFADFFGDNGGLDGLVTAIMRTESESPTE